MGLFDDLIPKAQQPSTNGLFDDLIPKSNPAPGLFDDLIPKPTISQAKPEGVIRGSLRALREFASPVLGETDRQMLNRYREAGDQRRGIVPSMGRAMGAAGNMAAGAVVDVMAKAAGTPEFDENLKSAFYGKDTPTDTLPMNVAARYAIEEDLDRGQFPAYGTGLNALIGGLKTAPKIALLPVAGPSLLGQSIAAGGIFGLGDDGEFHPKEAIIGAFMPSVGAGARLATSYALTKAIQSGATSLENTFAQKIIETLGEQAALNAYQVAAASPELVEQFKTDPNQAYGTVAEIIGSNLAFGLLGVKNFRGNVPSGAEQFILNHSKTYADEASRLISRQLLGKEDAQIVDDFLRSGPRGYFDSRIHVKTPEAEDVGGPSFSIDQSGPRVVRQKFPNASATYAGDQIYNALKNSLNPSEFGILDSSGLRDFLSQGRTVQEVQDWMEQNGPRVEVRSFKIRGSGYTPREEKLLAEKSRLEHELDTKYPDWYKPGYQAEGFDSLFDKFKQAEEAVSKMDRVGGASWSSIAPKAEKDLPEYAEIAVVRPRKVLKTRSSSGEIYTAGTEEAKFPTSHNFPPNTIGFVRGYMETLPNGKKVFHVIEVQSDWAQRQRKEANRQPSPDLDPNNPFAGVEVLGKKISESGDPLLQQYERLALKAAIDHAREQGADYIAISDAETAMMTEGHDRTVNSPLANFPTFAEADQYAQEVGADSVRTGRNGQFEVWSNKPTQENGMRLHYDQATMLVSPEGEIVERFPSREDAAAYARHNRLRVGAGEQDYKIVRGKLHDIVSELTGDSGQKASFGEHKMAMEQSRSGFDEPTPENTRLRQRKDLIFRDSSGAPKMDASALVYPLDKANAEFSLFGKDKPAQLGALRAALSIDSMHPDMETARRIAFMPAAEILRSLKSFNDINLELGRTATPEQVAELEQLRDYVISRYATAKRRNAELRTPATMQDEVTLSMMPQFYNEAISIAKERLNSETANNDAARVERPSGERVAGRNPVENPTDMPSGLRDTTPDTRNGMPRSGNFSLETNPRSGKVDSGETSKGSVPLYDQVLVKGLERAVRDRFGADSSDLPRLQAITSAEAAGLVRAHQRAVAVAEALGRAYGKRIIWFKGSNEYAPKGAEYSELDPSVVFLNASQAGLAPEKIVAHELGHHMKGDAPDLFSALQDHLLKNLSNEMQTKLNLAQYSYNEMPEEIVTHAIEAAFSRPETLQKALGKNPGLWSRFVSYIMDKWNAVVNKLFPSVNQFSKFPQFADQMSATREIERAFSEYKKMAESKISGESEGGPKFSIDLSPSQKLSRARNEAEGVDPAGKARLEQLDAVQSGDIHPDTRELIIERAFTAPKTVAEAVTKRLIRRTAELISVSDTPRDFNTITDPDQRGEAAIISTERHLALQREQAKIGSANANAAAEMEAAVKGMEKVPYYEIGRRMTGAMAERLATQDYPQYLKNLAKTAGANNNLAASAALLLKRSSQQAGGFVVAPGAIERALQEIADNPNIKTGREVAPMGGAERFYPSPDNSEFLNRVRFEGLKGVNDQTAFLLAGGIDGKGPGGVDPLLSRVKNLPEVIDALREIKAGSTKAAKEISDFQKAFSNTGRITKKGEATAVGVSTAMKRYASLIQKSKMADTVIRTLNKNYERARNNLLGADAAQSLINELLDNPNYRQSVQDAANVIGFRLDGLYNAVDGRFQTKGPYPEKGHDFIISRDPTRATQIKNRMEVTDLMSDINQFLQDPNADPIQKATWKQLGDLAQAQWLQNISNPLDAHLLGVRESPDLKHWSGFLAHTRTLHELITDKIAGPETYDLRRSMEALDAVTFKLRALELNADHGRKAIALKIASGAQSHGYETKNNSAALEQYRVEVLNPIASSLQHHGSIPLKAGDFIPFTSTKVTAEDVAALDALHKFEQGVRKISEHDMKVYGMPTRILDDYAGRRFQRESTTTGPMMLTRYFNAPDWLFADKRVGWKTGVTGDAREAQIKRLTDQMWSDPEIFRDVVLSYISETNPEFSRSQLFDKEFRKIASDARHMAMPISSLKDIVDAIAPMRKEPRPELEAMVKKELEREAVRVVDDFAGEVAQDLKPKDENAIDRAVYSSLRTEGAFLKPRGRMIAPSSFYQYAKVADSDVMRTPAVAITIGRARNLEKLKQVLSAYDKHRENLESEIKLAATSTTAPKNRRQKLAEIDKRARMGEIRYEWSILNRRIEQLTSEINMAENNLTKFDESFPPAFSRTALAFNRAISLQLLGSFGSAFRNLIGATFIQDAFIASQLGKMTGIATSPLKVSHAFVKVTMAKALNTVAKMNPKLASAVRDAMPFVDGLSKLMADQIETVKDLQSTGLIPRFDWSNKAAAKKALGFGGEILRPGGELPIHLRAVQWASTTPLGMFQELMFPRATDNLANEVNAYLAKSTLLKLFSKADGIGRSREVGGPLNPADPSQFITGKEVGLSETSWQNIRKLIEPIGSVESLMFDYYNRLKQADAAGQPRDQVPIVAPEQLQALLLSFGKLGNVLGETNTPAFYRGSWLRRVFGTFMNWPANFTALASKSSPSTVTTKEQAAMIPKLLLVGAVVSAVVIALKETTGALMPILTGKENTEPTLANVMENPTSADATRYWLGALGAGIPYLNVALSQGSDSRSIFDLSRTVPLAGWLKDTAGMTYDAARTGDVGKALFDYSNRYLPLYSSVINRLPGASDRLGVRNTQRALRAATPRSIEMRSISGGTANPTPLSRKLRAAEVAAYGGNRQKAKSALDEAITMKMRQKGISRQQAMNEVRQSISARQPEMQVYGRVLPATERDQVLRRMTVRQLRAYQAGQKAFGELLSLVPRQSAKKGRRLRSMI